MTGIKLGGSAIKILKEEVKSYEEYIIKTYNYIAEELKLNIRSVGGGSFDFTNALAFRIIQDEKEISLDRSIEIRMDKNGTLYLDTILGSIELKTLDSAQDFKKIANQLKKLKFTKHSDKIYTATVDILDHTLPEKADYQNSETISNVISDLPIAIFNKKDIGYKLAKAVRDPIILEFHSEIDETPEDEALTNEKQDENETSIDDTGKEKAADDNSTNDKREETQVSTDEDSSEQKNNSADVTSEEENNNAGAIKIITKKPASPSIKIGGEPTEEAASIKIVTPKERQQNTDLGKKALGAESNSEADISSVDSTAVSLPIEQVSWGQWAYDNIYPIAGTIICLAGGCTIYYKWTTPNLLPQTSTDLAPYHGSAIQRSLEAIRNSPVVSRVIESVSPSRTQRVDFHDGLDGTDNVLDGTDIRNVMSGHSPVFSPSSMFHGQRTPDMPNTPGVDRLLATAIKTANRIKGHDTATEEQVNVGATFLVGHLSHIQNTWLTNYKTEFLTFLQTFMQDKVRATNGNHIGDLLLENYRRPETLEFKSFHSLLKRSNWKDSTKITKLGLDTLYTEESDATPEDLLNDIQNTDLQLKYLLYLAMMTAIPTVKAKELTPEDYLNNNATEWHSLSMVTEDDLDDNEDSESYIVNYNNTHPELVFKAFSQLIENSYESQDTFELSFISDTNIKCRSVLKNSIEILGDTLYLTAHMTKDSNPLVTLFNNFYVIPELYSKVDSVCDSIEEPIDNAYSSAKEFYDSALELLGIESAE